MGTVMDVTERKEAAEALRASEHLALGQLDALKKTLDALSRESEPEKFLEHVLCTIIEQLSAHSIGVWEMNKSSGSTSFVANYEGTPNFTWPQRNPRPHRKHPCGSVSIPSGLSSSKLAGSVW